MQLIIIRKKIKKGERQIMAQNKQNQTSQTSGNKSNKAIECSVDNCVHHCGNDKFCALDKIQVGADTVAPKTPLATNCSSFRNCN
jgi:hypothetical protein